MRHRFGRLFIVLPTLLAIRVSAQTASQASTAQQATQQAAQPPAADLQRANTLFTQGDWQGTLEAYRALSTKYPSHALSRFRIGVALNQLGKPVEGEAEMRAGEKLGIPVTPAALRIAQALAAQKKPDAAIAELMRSAGGGQLVAPSTVDADPHFASLKSHARWQGVLNAFDAIARPCMHDPKFREFDFWVGDWDVRATGAPAVGSPARNNITLEENGCVVMEHWSAPSGSGGMSFNIYDRSYGVWRQTWIDNQGGQHDYRGNLKDGNMVFEGDTPAPGGKLGRVPTRLTLFHISADSVRQFSEQSTDGGKTWVTAYDLMYVRYKGPPRP